VFTSAEGWSFEGNFRGGGLADGVFYTDEGDIAANQAISAYALAEGWSYAGAINAKGQRGEGEFLFASGAKYHGEFLGGLASGRGVYTDEKGTEIYNGEWKNGLFEGKGIYNAPYESVYIDEKGNEIYIGEWKDGKAPYKYEGDFKGGKFDGKGTLTKKDGTVMAGTWKGGWRIKK